MSRDEVRIADAVASLTARLESWQVEDASTKAHEYVNDMLRAGWRPRALPVETPPVGRAMPAPVTVVQLARATLAQTKAQLCSHGVHPKLCKDRSHDEPSPTDPRETTEESDQ